MSEVEVVLEAAAELGEGPVWDAARGDLLWVDITAGRVHRWDPVSGADVTVEVGQDVGTVALRAGGGLVAAARDGVLGIAPDGAIERLAHVEQDVPGNRANDGKCDSAGRFWFGTMASDGSGRTGRLYRLDADGTLSAVVDDLQLSNGLGWSPDDRTMYLIDTARQAVDAFDFDARDGNLANRRRLVTVDDADGSPDGMAVDADGFLWIALYGGSAVHRYTPDGRLDTVLPVPVPQPTCVTFGGPALDDLYITSAREGMSEADLAAAPLSGAVLRHRPGVRGLPATAYRG